MSESDKSQPWSALVTEESFHTGDHALAPADSESEFRLRLERQLRQPLGTIMELAGFLLLEPALTGKDQMARQITHAGQEMLDVINRELGQPPAAAKPTGAESTGENGKRPILCIEDNLAGFKAIQLIVANRPDLQLAHAKTGQEGLCLARVRRPQVILLDLDLPDMHGSEVLRQLKLEPDTASIPVVVISADATSSQIERLLSAGARNYLTKPFEFLDFLAVIDQILEEKAEA